MQGECIPSDWEEVKIYGKARLAGFTVPAFV